MAYTTGTVTSLMVNKNASEEIDFAMFYLQPVNGDPSEKFIVWYAGIDPSPPTATDWIARNIHIAMLRDALLQKLTVTVTHDDSSNFYTTLEVAAPTN